MNKQRIDEIRARESAASPGPWTVEKFGRYEDHDECRIELNDDTLDSCRYENADFIADARQAVPELLAENERLNAALAAETKRADEAEAEASKITEERDKWLTYAHVFLEELSELKECFVCVHHDKEDEEEPCNDCLWAREAYCADAPHFQYDAARFEATP